MLRKLFPALIIVLLAVLAACGSSPSTPSRSATATTSDVAELTPVPMEEDTSVPVPTKTASATTTPTPTPIPPTPTPTPTPAYQPAAGSVFLEPMAYEPQTWNNCAPVSTKMVLSYFGISVTQDEASFALRPHRDDKHVDAVQIARYLEGFGLKALPREAGDAGRIKTLLSNGVPVMVAQWLLSGDDIGHYRVLRGYDDAQGIWHIGDSYYGADYQLTYEELDSLWRAFDRRYIVVYRPEQEEMVKAILGPDWDTKTMYENALQQAVAQTEANPSDIDGWLMKGQAYLGLENYGEAVNAWEKAESIGIPRRLLWYQSWPVMAYNKVGNYDRVMSLTDSIFATGIGVYGEMRIERAKALIGLGRTDLAMTELEKAIVEDSTLTEARALLDSL